MNAPALDSREGVVEELLPGGESLIRYGTDSFLSLNGVPGDRVLFQETQKRRGARRGKIIKVLQAAVTRIEPLCSVAEQCGGCSFQFVPYTQQAEIKSTWVKQEFADLMQPHTRWLPLTGDSMHARRRVRWQVGEDRQGWFLGFFAPASHRPVRQQHCMVLTSELQAVREQLEQQSLQGIQTIQAVQLTSGIHVILETAVYPDQIHIGQQTPAGTEIQWWWREKGILRPLHRPVKRFYDQLPAGNQSIELEIGPNDFVQGQFEGNRTLIRQIQQWSDKPKRVADLFCGCGNLSLPLAVATGADVYGAEYAESSIRAAAKNAKCLDVQGAFVAANLFEDFDMEPYIGADVLILDPPRRGAKRICQHIQHLWPKKIIMVSCDPAAGARDGALLASQGYQLKALRALDLFSYAGHVEVLSLWEPA